jgi:DnaJ-class molecular chaperone
VDGEPEDEEEKTEICNVCAGSGMGYHGPDSVCRTCGGDGEICAE